MQGLTFVYFQNTYQFLALSEGGLINIFDTNTTSKGITPAAAVAKIEDKADGAEADQATNIPYSYKLE